MVFSELINITIQLHGGAGHWRCTRCHQTGFWTEMVHSKAACDARSGSRARAHREQEFSPLSALRSSFNETSSSSNLPEYVAARAALEKDEVLLLILGVDGPMSTTPLGEFVRIVHQKEGGKVVHVNIDPKKTTMMKALLR